jgi:PAS domain S-box-containing protein
MIPISLHENRKKNPLHRAFLLLAALLLVTALCSPPAAAARDVKVALTELKPTLFTDDQGKPAGFFVDIIDDLAVREGWNVIWVRGSLSESWNRLNTSEIDLMPGVADTQEREKFFNFTRESALSVWSQVYAHPGSGISTILDLDGKRVAIVRGDISGIAFRDYARKFAINATYTEREIPTDTFAAVAAGDADALVVFNMVGQEDAKTYGLAATPVMFNPTPLGFAVPKGKNQDLLMIIDRYIAGEKDNPSSTYNKAMQKWFGINRSPIIPPSLLWGLAIAACVAVLFVIMSFLLRREVRKKTAELSRQNAELQSEIASRTRAEKELADEMSRSEILIDQSRDGIVILDQEGAVYKANRRFAEMLGYTREEMQHLHLWDWDVRFDREQLHNMIRNVDATGDHFESRHRRKDGTIIDVEVSSNAEVFSDRKLIFCIARDTSQRKKAEQQLKRYNEEIHAAYEQLSATEEELRVNYQELRKSDKALMQARKKLNLLNTLTFQDFQSGIFSLTGYIQLAKGAGCSDDAQGLLKKGEEVLRSVSKSLDFAKKYQDLGISQPRWQNVNYALINAISHLDFSRISRTVDLAGLEIYADPLLEDVFFTLMENVLTHGEGATAVHLHCRKNRDSITILVEDNGPGIPAQDKEKIFGREYPQKGGNSLFLAREILSITDISITETGVPGTGTRFEITVPEGEYRIGGTQETPGISPV